MACARRTSARHGVGSAVIERLLKGLRDARRGFLGIDPRGRELRDRHRLATTGGERGEHGDQIRRRELAQAIGELGKRDHIESSFKLSQCTECYAQAALAAINAEQYFTARAVMGLAH